MIQRLLIKNYAIIDKLEIDFSDKLTIITGETGAGKSILLGALGLIMGRRADTKVLYNRESKCVVEGYFDVSRYDLKSFFKEHDIDYAREVIIRRELTPSGKSRAFINDTPVKLPELKRLSDALIDLHQQFDTLDIHQVSFQLRMIDALADNRRILEKYSKHYNNYQAARRKLDKLVEQNARALQEVDFFQFQLDELLEAALEAYEQEQLETEQKTLANAEDIKRILSQASHQLNENEHSILNQLNDINSAIQSVRDL